jgi:hypothetical protein
MGKRSSRKIPTLKLMAALAFMASQREPKDMNAMARENLDDFISDNRKKEAWSCFQLTKAERKGKTPEEIAELRLRKFRKLSQPSFLA